MVAGNGVGLVVFRVGDVGFVDSIVGAGVVVVEVDRGYCWLCSG